MPADMPQEKPGFSLQGMLRCQDWSYLCPGLSLSWFCGSRLFSAYPAAAKTRTETAQGVSTVSLTKSLPNTYRWRTKCSHNWKLRLLLWEAADCHKTMLAGVAWANRYSACFLALLSFMMSVKHAISHASALSRSKRIHSLSPSFQPPLATAMGTCALLYKHTECTSAHLECLAHFHDWRLPSASNNFAPAWQQWSSAEPS